MSTVGAAKGKAKHVYLYPVASIVSSACFAHREAIYLHILRDLVHWHSLFASCSWRQ
jgi:hypothetical protein